MSDSEVLKAIEQLEAILKSDPGSLDAETIDRWQGRFQLAVASSERGQEWPRIVARAQLLQESLTATTAVLAAQRDAIKRELENQGLGSRALKAYRTGVR